MREAPWEAGQLTHTNSSIRAYACMCMPAHSACTTPTAPLRQTDATRLTPCCPPPFIQSCVFLHAVCPPLLSCALQGGAPDLHLPPAAHPLHAAALEQAHDIRGAVKVGCLFDVRGSLISGCSSGAHAEAAVLMCLSPALNKAGFEAKSTASVGSRVGESAAHLTTLQTATAAALAPASLDMCVGSRLSLPTQPAAAQGGDEGTGGAAQELFPKRGGSGAGGRQQQQQRK